MVKICPLHRFQSAYQPIRSRSIIIIIGIDFFLTNVSPYSVTRALTRALHVGGISLPIISAPRRINRRRQADLPRAPARPIPVLRQRARSNDINKTIKLLLVALFVIAVLIFIFYSIKSFDCCRTDENMVYLSRT